jgi:hypothetical protein
LFCLDTGINGNIFAGNYFDLNQYHLQGKLKKMYIGSQMQKVGAQTLTLRPTQAKKTSKPNSDL